MKSQFNGIKFLKSQHNAEFMVIEILFLREVSSDLTSLIRMQVKGNTGE